MTEDDVITLIRTDPWMMDVLEAVEKLNLKDWWIGAGFVRGKVWDRLHEYKQRTPLPDIDVIYFDQEDIDEQKEKYYESLLSNRFANQKWSVKNQARMHVLHRHQPYHSASEGLSYWVETATCVGVRLGRRGEIELTAPYGIEDLGSLVVKPTPDADLELFEKRLKEKEWLSKWPKLRVVSR
jgi:uncharacterized protein